jgi:tRNA G37 N-methylase Trm5
MVTAEHAERIRQWHDRAVVAVDINPHAVETAQRTE